ncbi:MAG: carbamoyltransferase [Endomicrobiales bacterium]|nr:carbamoyltransferase [Endomicrobiales bacterium]
MYILGISCWYHDAAAAILKDGHIIACSEEERFSRIKHDYSFPINAINFCIEQAGISAGDIDYVVFYDKPILKFERIVATCLKNVPKSSRVFVEAIPLWLKEKLHFRRIARKTLGINENRILFCKHHVSHAYSAYVCSPFKEAAILTVDGVGEWATASLGYGEGSKAYITDEMYFPNSVGLLYSTFTAFLGFRVNEGEYKVMGMAAYGEPKYVDKIMKIMKINGDGTVGLNLDYFAFTYSVSRMYSDKFIKLFGEPRAYGTPFFTKDFAHPEYNPEKFGEQARKNQYYADIAASIQLVCEQCVVKMAKYLREKTGKPNLCYAGGVALNSKANYSLLTECGFNDIYIQPNSTDAGGALGAALWCWCEVLGKERKEVLEHNYWGKGFSKDDVSRAIKNNNGFKAEELNDDKLNLRISEALCEGKVVGWYQGRTEWGPRALGNRSILADPRDPKMKELVNTKIKFREPFRPFAPSVLEEDKSEFFEKSENNYPQRFMMITYPVKNSQRERIPAVVHVDGTSRIQSVIKKYNPRYWSLINQFKGDAGIGLVLNTSFNLKDEPIVNTPENAINTFLRSGIDILVMESFLLKKA